MVYDYSKTSIDQKEDAGTIIINKDYTKILLVKGKRSSKWGPPKGHIENNENIMNAAIRETYEETGLLLNESQAYKYKNTEKPYFVVLTKIVFFVFVIDDIEDLDPIDKNEISEVKWFNIEYLKGLKLCKNNENFNSPLRYLFSENNQKFKLLQKSLAYNVPDSISFSDIPGVSVKVN